MSSCSLKRRNFVLSALSFPLAAVFASAAHSSQEELPGSRCFEFLEKNLDGRLGVFAWDTGTGRQLGYRADERFPFCSTFKVLVAAAILHRSASVPGLLSRRIPYESHQLVANSPVTEGHVGAGMSVADLCAAALQYSDNTAANLLMELLGGPAAVTAFARSLRDNEFRLDRWETELNTAIPNDPRDTTTPKAMAISLKRLLLGNGLGPRQRARLRGWMRRNTTGAARIKAGIPARWQVADKTGTGAYGTANDIAVLWPKHRAAVVVAIYTTRREHEAEPRNDIVAAAAAVVVDWLR